MAEQIGSEKWQEIRQIHGEFIDLYKLLGAGLLILIGVLIGRATYPGQEWAFGMNLSTEIVGIALTVGIIEWFNQRRERRLLQQQLIRDAGSISNEIAKNAIYQITHRGWLSGKNGLLKEAYLAHANLENVRLMEANLRSADLSQAKLRSAVLGYADLQGAEMMGADLRGAYLEQADLQGTSLFLTHLEGALINSANLENANLKLAFLHGATLLGANLRGADLRSAHFNGETQLPNGDYWTPETDLRRFTNPAHPEFLEFPFDVDSPYDLRPHTND